MKLQLPAQFLIFASLLVILNIIQAALTPLIFDEAYYWYYAQNLAFGYFDHPPMVAWMVKLGSQIFPGELGVRFVSSLLSGATAIVLWNTIDKVEKEKFIPHFFVLLFSMVLINAYGFLTLPDTPLLFFTALFLWSYKKYLDKPGLTIAVVLGLCMAGLMYSKYHAFLVIFFVGISNLRLLSSKYIWVAIGVGLLAYLPHLWWLLEYDFVTIRYHLFDRPNRAYDFSDFTLGYFLNLIVIFGFTFPWIYKVLFKSLGNRDQFGKSLTYLIFGILLFFFVSSFSRRVQTQWIIVICIPTILVVYSYLIEHTRVRKYLWYSGLLNVVILLFLRVGLAYEPLFPVIYETHGNKEWVAAIANDAEGIPVIFENSYRRAPMYSFYTGNPSFSLNNIMYRQNQYSIDSSEALVRDGEAYYVSSFPLEGAKKYPTLKGDTLYGKKMEYFEPYRKLRIEIFNYSNREVRFKVKNPYPRDISMEDIKFGVAFLNKYKQVLFVEPIEAQPVLMGSKSLPDRSDLEFRGLLPSPESPEVHYFQLTISENGLYWGLNGRAEKLDDGS